jgi:hypothetical protein
MKVQKTKYKKIASRCLSLLLLFLLVIQVPIDAYAADEFAETELVLGYSPKFSMRIVLSEDAITIENVPHEPEYNYLWLQFKSVGGDEKAFDEIVERDSDNNAVFSKPNAPDGIYRLELYRSNMRGSGITFSAIIYGNDICVQWSKGNGIFYEPEYYSYNTSVRSDKRDDIAALTYYLAPSRGIQSDDMSITALAAQLTAGAVNSYDKAMAIHDWVCENIYYNYDAYYGRVEYGDTSAVGTLASKRSVCDGYSNLTAALLRAAGIPAKKISGFALGISSPNGFPVGFTTDGDTNHAWNEAFVGGRWIIIDTTWDSGNEWENGKISEDTGLQDHHYFDANPSLFSADHVIKNYDEAPVDDFVKTRTQAAAPFTGSVIVNKVFHVTPTMYTMNSTNYIKLRDVSAILSGVNIDVGITWNSATYTIGILPDQEYEFTGDELSGGVSGGVTSASLATVRVEYNGVSLYAEAYSIDNSTYFKLRDLGKLFDFDVDYDTLTRTVGIYLKNN